MKLIDKDKVVAEIEKMRDKAYPDSEWNHGYVAACEKILSFLDTLEAKEADLEKELETLDSLLYDLDGVAVKGTSSYLTVEDVKDIAKWFFELGIKAKGK